MIFPISYTEARVALRLHANLLAALIRQVLLRMAAEPFASLRAVLLGLFLLACLLAYLGLALPLLQEQAGLHPRIGRLLVLVLALVPTLVLARRVVGWIQVWQREGLTAGWPLSPHQQRLIQTLAIVAPLAWLPLCLGSFPFLIQRPDLLGPALLRAAVLGVLVSVRVLGRPHGHSARRLLGDLMLVLAALAWTDGYPRPLLPQEPVLLSVAVMLFLAWSRWEAAVSTNSRTVPMSPRPSPQDPGRDQDPWALLARAGMGVTVPPQPAPLLLGLLAALPILAFSFLPDGTWVQALWALLLGSAVLNLAWARIHAGRSLLRLVPLDTPGFLHQHRRALWRLGLRVGLPMLLAALPGGTASQLAVLLGLLIAVLLSAAGVLLHLVADGHKYRELLVAMAWLLPPLAFFLVLPPLVPVLAVLATLQLWRRTRKVREHDAC